MKPKSTLVALSLSTAITALGLAAPAMAEIIVPEGNAGTALRLTDDMKVVGRIEGLGNVHGLAAAPRRRLVIAGSLEEVSRSEIARPKGVSEDEHAVHHGGGMKKRANDGAVGLVSFVDLASGAVIRQVEVPAGVHHVTVDPGERWAVVTHPALDAVSVIDLETAKVTATVETGSNPNYAVFDSETGLFWVSNAASGTVTAVDPAAGVLRNTIETPGGIEHMVIDVKGRRIWGAEAEDGRVDEIDLAAGRVVRSIEIGGELHGIARDPASGKVFAAAREQGKLATIDPASGTVRFAEAGPEPYHIEVDGDLLAVSDAEVDVIRAYRIPDMSLVAEVPTRARGHQMVVLTN
jgi:YVTN family beta-propeller protein